MVSVDERRTRPWTVIAGLGGLVAMVSAALPWFGVSGVLPEVNGLDAVGDGWYTLAIGLGVLILAVRSLVTHRPWRRQGTLATIVGFFVVAIPALGYSNFRLTAMLIDPSLGDLVAPGIGLYGTVVGGLLIIGGGWFNGRARRRQARAERAA